MNIWKEGMLVKEMLKEGIKNFELSHMSNWMLWLEVMHHLEFELWERAECACWAIGHEHQQAGGENLCCLKSLKFWNSELVIVYYQFVFTDIERIKWFKNWDDGEDFEVYVLVWVNFLTMSMYY